MTIEEMRDHLTQIQNESFQTKVLNSILTCYAEIKHKKMHQQKCKRKLMKLLVY